MRRRRFLATFWQFRTRLFGNLASVFRIALTEDEMMATGTYAGDGTNDRLISTGLSGSLRYIRILDFAPGAPGLEEQYDKSDTMPAKVVHGIALADDGSSASGFEDNLVAIIGADFTVDAGGTNNLGKTYHWVAFSTNP